MNTHHASYQRASRERILRDFSDLRSLDYVTELIHALPYVATILNQQRQIVFSNEALLEKMGICMEEVLGQRPGEALNCIHARDMEAGCGTSTSCRVCGAVNTILKCENSGKAATGQCRIRVHDDRGYEDSLDLEVTAAPFNWGKSRFIIFAARDISGEKRREALERIFFHDVINTAGTLQGVVDMLKQLSDPDKIRSFIDLLSMVSHDLTEEILIQKSLLSAENGELAVDRQMFYLSETVGYIVNEYRRHELAHNREISFVSASGELTLYTDPVLLRRILGNMIKNALEAIREGERVTVDCSRKPGAVSIWVHNPGSMHENVRKQVFQRSFSTTGKGRGLGTYSMKLLGEKYLGGKVSFSSSEKNGTIFCIELPLDGPRANGR
jgi:K+-sensing histidine kinase KdpD